eukprot:10718520-Alexandrium_andersonii.AAC.1
MPSTPRPLSPRAPPSRSPPQPRRSRRRPLQRWQLTLANSSRAPLTAQRRASSLPARQSSPTHRVLLVTSRNRLGE